MNSRKKEVWKAGKRKEERGRTNHKAPQDGIGAKGHFGRLARGQREKKIEKERERGRERRGKLGRFGKEGKKCRKRGFSTASGASRGRGRGREHSGEQF